MIKSFSCKETERIWNNTVSKKLPADIQRQGLIKLRILEAAVELDDLRVPPGNRLEALKGDRKDQHAIRINKQWRIFFKWKDHHAEQVKICDYH
jgi:proteic killer suppression protein